ncbi:hypothetical protein L2E82_16088 [Cichorium intybus]|uniref:Uncharacterized protein n=1 Tax=Cichorium intybus TaxID=13427 RepID=A0ACB9F553_CICIN|nr:hypothetical protein L2E82_16088 [Cichorium intybus]
MEAVSISILSPQPQKQPLEFGEEQIMAREGDEEEENDSRKVFSGVRRTGFSVKTKYASHPLFTMLLEDAETEYGYTCEGPISLPFAVDRFYKLLVAIEAQEVQPLG